MSQVAGSLWTEFYFKSAPPAATELNIPPGVDIPSAGDIRSSAAIRRETDLHSEKTDSSSC